MNLQIYIINNFGFNEPVLTEELYTKLDVNRDTIIQLLKRSTNSGDIEKYRYKDDVYFVPNPNWLLNKTTLSLNKVISKKYLIRDGNRIGYITGLAFLNQLRLTTQNPATIEIVTQSETMEKREVDYKIRRVILRRPLVKEINDNNFKVLQVLDLMNNIDKLSAEPADKVTNTIKEYLSEIKIDREELERCLKEYPLEVQTKMVEDGVFNELL